MSQPCCCDITTLDGGHNLSAGDFCNVATFYINAFPSLAEQSTEYISSSTCMTLPPNGQTNIMKNIVVILRWQAIPRKPILNDMVILTCTRS